MKQIMDTDPEDTFFRFRLDKELLHQYKMLALSQRTTIREMLISHMEREVERAGRGSK